MAIKAERKHKWRKALRWYREALKINPRFLPALLNAGSIYLGFNKKRSKIEAEKYFRRALKLDPRNPLLFVRLAQSCQYRSKRDGPLSERALEFYLGALELDPYNAEAHLELGAGYSELPSDKAKAIRHYVAFLKLSPGESSLTRRTVEEDIRRLQQEIGMQLHRRAPS